MFRPRPRREVGGSGRGQVSRPRPRGGEVGGSGRGGVSRPRPRGRLGGLAGECPGPHRGRGSRPRGGCPGPGGVSQQALRQTPPPPGKRLLRVVRILLECILVLIVIPYLPQS